MQEAPRFRRTLPSALWLALAVSACELVIGLDGERLRLDGEGGEAGFGAGNGGAFGAGRGGAGKSGGSAGAVAGSAADAGRPEAVAGAGQAGAGTTGGSGGESDGAGGDSGQSTNGGSSGAGGEPSNGEGGVPSEGGRPGEDGIALSTPSCLEREPLECAHANPCLTINLPGGTFRMGRSADGSDRFEAGSAHEQPEHDATVDAFRLDKHEVTVGRFRRFVDAYDGTPPSPNEGSHPNVLGSGWQPEWNELLPSSQDALRERLTSINPDWNGLVAWTAEPGENECWPMNFIDWYLAFAFCIWDGGRLPSEAEWEFAATGDEENRLYPWGQTPPTDRHAVFRCAAAGTPGCEPGDLLEIGSRRPRGDGRFGHSDLAGSVAEFVRDCFDHDYYSSPYATEPNPMNLGYDVANLPYVTRGGHFMGEGPLLRTASRLSTARTARAPWFGVRCARQP